MRLLLISLIAAMTACVGAQPPRFSVQGHSMMGDTVNHRRAAEAMRDAGIGMVRDECYWSVVERERGEFEIPQNYLQNLDTNIELGIETLLILNYMNDLYDEGLAPHTEEGRAAFGAYCEAMAEALQGRVRYFEVWNEPNAAGFWPPEPNPENYAALVAVANEAIKSVIPDATVIAGSTSGTDEEFFRRAFEAGMADHCDAISIHPYCTPATPEEARIFERMEAIRDMSGEFGDPLDVWITEFGYPTRGASSVSEDQQANVISRTYLLALTKPWVVSTFLYWFGPDQGTDDWNENNFSLLHHDWSPKPSYAAMQTLTGLFASAEFSETLDVAEGIQAHVFSIPASGEFTHLTALWAESGIRHVQVFNDARAHLTSCQGDSAEMQALRGGFLSLDLCEQPIYLHTQAPPEIAEPDSPLVHFVDEEITITSRSLHQTVTVQAQGPGGSLSGERSEFLPVQDFFVGQWPIRPNPGISIGRHFYDQLVSGPHGFTGRIVLVVNVVQSAELFFTPLLPEQDHDRRFVLEMESQAGAIPNGVVRVTSESGDSIEPAEAELGYVYSGSNASGAPSAEFAISTQQPPDFVHSLRATCTANSGEVLEASDTISFMTSPRTSSLIILDGDLSDWPEWDAIHIGSREQITGEFEEWGGPEDASALVYTAWDDTHFYFAAEVQDQTLCDSVFGHEMYKNDGFEVYFDADHEGDRADARYSDDDNQFGVGPSQGEAVVWAYSHLNDVSPTSRVVMNREPTADQTVSGNDCGWIVEAAFPLDEINLVDPHHGMLIGFNVALNDDDDPSRVHPFGQDLQMMWNGRNECWLSPQNFSDLFLVEPDLMAGD